MKKLTLLNIGKVQKAVKGTDGKVYYLPPRSPKSLPAGVEISEGMHREIKITVSES
ncbi:MAG: hypothetical protein HKO92_06520 [Flavobacteriaceae bacterium]|nr:hypothetical protein [Flavobacteriaceae bacterium]